MPSEREDQKETSESDRPTFSGQIVFKGNFDQDKDNER